jgi:DNA-binding HxlR family transcriptional regulator
MKTYLAVENCPIRDILSQLGDKWSLLVLITLESNGVMRFSDIQKSIGDISQRMLTVTLRSLEADGLISRRVYAEVPPKVEYCLTTSGYELLPHIKSLEGWAQKNCRNIVAAREQYKLRIRN